MKDRYVSTREIGMRNSAGVAYLIIPSLIDRDAYIEDCYRRGCCTIAFESGGIFENAIIAKHVFNELEFPQTPEEIGTMLFWVNIPKLNTISIIGAMNKNNELINIGENQFIISKKNGNNYIEISGNAKNGKVIINVEGDRVDHGEMNIHVSNPLNAAKLNVTVKGNINVDVLGSVNIRATRSLKAIIKDTTIDKLETVIKYEKGVGLSYNDEFENEIYANRQRVQIKPKIKLDIGEGKEPLLLGTTMSQFLTEFIAILASSTTTTALGIMPLLNAAQIAQMTNKVQSLLSKYANTD